MHISREHYYEAGRGIDLGFIEHKFLMLQGRCREKVVMMNKAMDLFNRSSV